MWPNFTHPHVVLNMFDFRSAFLFLQIYKKSSEKPTISSAAPKQHKDLKHRSLSPSPSRSESHMVRFIERSVSSEIDHSEIRSLDDLFPVAAAPDSDDTLSERSAVSDGKTPVDLTSSNHLARTVLKYS